MHSHVGLWPSLCALLFLVSQIAFFCAMTVLGHCKGIYLLYKTVMNLFPRDLEPS